MLSHNGGAGGGNNTKMLTGRVGCGVGRSVGYLLMNILDQVHLVRGDIGSEKIKKRTKRRVRSFKQQQKESSNGDGMNVFFSLFLSLSQQNK